MQSCTSQTIGATEGREELRRVLIVRVDHHHDVGAFGQRQGVAGLLIRAVSAIDGVHVHAGSGEEFRSLHRVVPARVVDDDHPIDEIVGEDFFMSPFERARRVVRRHHDHGRASLPSSPRDYPCRVESCQEIPDHAPFACLR
jgi:hypothetical protein